MSSWQINSREPRRPQRHATTLRGAASPAAAWPLARLAGKAASAALEQSARTRRPQRDAARLRGAGRRQRFQSLGTWRGSPATHWWVSLGNCDPEQCAKPRSPAALSVVRPWRGSPAWGFMGKREPQIILKTDERKVVSNSASKASFVTTPGGFMGKREPQIILKTDERKIVLEMGLEGKFAAKSTDWDDNQVFLEGDKLEVAVVNGRWVLTHLPAAPRPMPMIQHYFPTE